MMRQNYTTALELMIYAKFTYHASSLNSIPTEGKWKIQLTIVSNSHEASLVPKIVDYRGCTIQKGIGENILCSILTEVQKK